MTIPFCAIAAFGTSRAQPKAVARRTSDAMPCLRMVVAPRFSVLGCSARRRLIAWHLNGVEGKPDARPGEIIGRRVAADKGVRAGAPIIRRLARRLFGPYSLA